MENTKSSRLYFDVHCNFGGGCDGYSIPVAIDSDEALTDGEVISFAKQKNLFKEAGDEAYVDTVTPIDFEDFMDLVGC